MLERTVKPQPAWCVGKRDAPYFAAAATSGTFFACVGPMRLRRWPRCHTAMAGTDDEQVLTVRVNSERPWRRAVDFSILFRATPGEVSDSMPRADWSVRQGEGLHATILQHLGLDQGPIGTRPVSALGPVSQSMKPAACERCPCSHPFWIFSDWPNWSDRR